ncbi:MAG: DUF998 domain-containing protein [Mycobacteriaceae bacterium]
MTSTAVSPVNSNSSATCSPRSRVTKSLLGYGVLAGPFYIVVSLAQSLAHQGFDLTRHDWSLLATGPQGWIQMANLVITGIMVIAFAIGASRSMPSVWAPRLVVLYGVGLVGAGLLVADPRGGYPVGSPAATQLSLHGAGHMIAGMIGFAGLILATFVVARRLAIEDEPRAAWATRAVGLCFLAGISGVASGSSTPAITLTFTAAVLAVWVWLAALAVHLYRQVQAEGSEHRS